MTTLVNGTTPRIAEVNTHSHVISNSQSFASRDLSHVQQGGRGSSDCLQICEGRIIQNIQIQLREPQRGVNGTCRWLQNRFFRCSAIWSGTHIHPACANLLVSTTCLMTRGDVKVSRCAGGLCPTFLLCFNAGVQLLVFPLFCPYKGVCVLFLNTDVQLLVFPLFCPYKGVLTVLFF